MSEDAKDRALVQPEAVPDAARLQLVKRGRAARNKGARGENEVCEILTRHSGKVHKRILGQARDSGCDARYGPFLLEIKRQQRNKMAQWQKQVSVAARDVGLLPAVVWRRDGDKWWIACPFEEFVQIFEAMRQGPSNGTPRPDPGDGNHPDPADENAG